MAKQNTLIAKGQAKIKELQDLIDRRQQLDLDTKENQSALSAALSDQQPQEQQKEAGSIITVNGGQDLVLSELLAKILVANGNEGMLYGDLTEAALASGWTTASSKPKTIVGQCMVHDADFIGRGKKPKKYSLSKRAYTYYKKMFS